MKRLFLVITVLAFNLSNAQKLRVNEVDEFTEYSKKITNYYNLARSEGGSLTIKTSVAHIDDMYAMLVKSNADLGCAGAHDNYIIFIFEDKSKLKLDRDVSDIDCSDSAVSIFNLTDHIDTLLSKKITKVRFSQSKHYTDGITYGTYTLDQLIKVTQ